MAKKKVHFFNSYKYDYSDVLSAFTFRNLFDWTNAVLKIRRTSDSATAFVFFDRNTITINSLISIISNTTPSSTTLSAWISTDDGYVEEWLSINNGGAIGKIASQTTISKQPQFISGGSIITANNLPTIDFLSSTRTLSAPQFIELADGEDFTVVTVTGNDNTEDVGAIICNSNTSTNRFVVFNDTRTTGGVYRAGLIQTSGGTYGADLLTANGSTNQRNILVLHDGGSKELTSYLNGVEQNNVTWTNTHTNNALRFGAQQSELTEITGNIQEVLIWQFLKSGIDLSNLNKDINAYYII